MFEFIFEHNFVDFMGVVYVFLVCKRVIWYALDIEVSKKHEL